MVAANKHDHVDSALFAEGSRGGLIEGILDAPIGRQLLGELLREPLVVGQLVRRLATGQRTNRVV